MQIHIQNLIYAYNQNKFNELHIMFQKSCISDDTNNHAFISCKHY